MEAPSSQAMSISEDTQDKVVDECCSCCYDCLESFFYYLCCDFLC
ncbi:hypothetical protein IHE45_02G077600 [Dioscorea alata]|uniref:Uncharacterized protein n=1 Tax=Dioscorea alata TaxID=55571 RepID=A0ACB7WRM2_DIOAL|nr:hypothetical protein IHE45_02G077600 [Dioscorea alata]